jgi:hypothetical protein
MAARRASATHEIKNRRIQELASSWNPTELEVERYLFDPEYASGYGAIGWGEVNREDGYKLVLKGSPDDKLGWNRHRLDVAWRSVAPKLDKGIPAGIVERELGIYHPVGTRAWIAPEKAKQLQEALISRFGLAQGVHPT